MFKTFLQITALLVTLIATFFWIRGSSTLSVKDIAALSGTYWNYNPATLKNLASQKADSIIAALLLLFSFLLQFSNLAWPVRIGDFEINKRGIVASIIFSFVLFGICYFVTSGLTKHFYSKAEILLQQHNEQNKQGTVPNKGDRNKELI